MGDIKHLPEAVHSSVRSGIILFDLARVVEELIFNSLDAGATKISVAVGVGTCYIKVVDNGVGITRDGLVLLGERYATSKFDQLAETDAVTTSFGFRGEALSSISDVSLLEVITKTHGRPNGYRKVMKGCKCLYLGIDDSQRDVGTTVIVRDLFYNQPVRRKQIQSSTKKVLQSVKNCVLRIALIHPKVLFKVVDMESDDALFSTAPSSSTLSLLTSGFGVELSSSLHELSVSDGVIKLLGYMSTPFDTSSVKVLQYVCIHEVAKLILFKVYISKGPVHKLLNQLATRFNDVDQQKNNIGSHNAKRIRSQTSTIYILNLICPRSWYDITFEPSNTSVEFKDWFPLAGFIEKTVIRFWSEKLSYGYSLGHRIDISEEDNMRRETDKTSSLEEGIYEIPKRRCAMNKEGDMMYYQKGNRFNASEFGEHQTGLGFDCEVDYSFQSCDGLQEPDTNVFPAKDHFTKNDVFAEEKSKDFILDSSLEDGHLNMDCHKSNGYTGCALSFKCSKRGNGVDNVSHNVTKPFLRHCSARESLDRESLVSSDGFDFEIDGLRTKRKRLEPYDQVDIGEVDDIDQRFDFGQRNQWLDEVVDDSPFGSSDWPFASKQSPVMSDPSSLTKPLVVEHFFGENALESCIKCDIGARYDYLEDWEIKDHIFHFDNTMQDSSTNGNCSLSRWTNKYSDSKSYDSFSGDSRAFLQHRELYDAICPKYSDVLTDDTEWFCFDSHGKHNGNLRPMSHHISSSVYMDKDENQKTQFTYQEREYVCKKRPRRSNSAPPSYRGKKKFVALSNLVMEDGKTKIHTTIDDVPTSEETSELKYSQRSARVCKLHSESSSVEDLLVYTRPDEKKATDMSDFQDFMTEQKSKDRIYSMNSGEENQDPSDSGLKWRKSYPRNAHAERLQNVHNEDTVLDVSSGILHLAGESLVPESINKNCLEHAKVLQQVDKKFIPVVGSGVLAIIDQHAADERIRLEEFRQKVLSGEEKTVTYLDNEENLVLPEIEYQLLHTYAEQIQSWGWLCNIHARGSKSFKKNLNLLQKQPTSVRVLAVPCILGVNLTDVDLLEFLQQLAETDGSSTIPPAVHRVLNFKACRGAIMFGDPLLPSECSLIVEELKQTSLCFQCAHGRPTTVPLVNLEALHKQIAKLGSWNGGSNGSWHSLRRHQLSLERASHRLSSAIGDGR
ncbi:hypothetical protein Vadar_002232 [Vaccinium darrowii]|uniref:Uncharacterized protein n=1 Tax=Vaccinium darrowii TaxID=229202 RepID=A0ACB7Y4E2_9ERIC|nr:hypothetical protein Vadar_002232 [Vaccinium darrowii]